MMSDHFGKWQVHMVHETTLACEIMESFQYKFDESLRALLLISSPGDF